MQDTTLPIRTRMRLAAAGMLVGLAGLVGLAVVDPELVPWAEHGGICGLLAALAGAVAMFAVHRFWPHRLPGWVLGPAGRAGSAR
ncbi:hypothetical protein [Nitrospira calida]|jgi:peptidoglycan/LPS O-acetylase OafA/YrhL